jgi:hypothetical protein
MSFKPSLWIGPGAPFKSEQLFTVGTVDGSVNGGILSAGGCRVSPCLSGRVEVDEALVGGEEEGVHGRQTETKAMIEA